MSYADNIRWAIAHLDPALAFVLGLVALTVLLNGWRIIPPLVRESWAWMRDNLGESTCSDVVQITEADRQRIRQRALAELEAEQRRRLNALTMTDRERIVYGAFDRTRQADADRLMREGRY